MPFCTMEYIIFVDRVGVVLTGVLSWVDGKESPFLEAQADLSLILLLLVGTSVPSVDQGCLLLRCWFGWGSWRVSCIGSFRIITLVSLVIILSVKSKSWSLNYHTSLTCDNSRMFLRVYLLIQCPSPGREVKHKLVNMILIYFISNNAFYINENVTHSYDLRCK